MRSSQSHRSQPYRLLEKTGLPAEFFRYLIKSCGVGIGSRVRVTGCDDRAITEYLACLGFDVCDEQAASDSFPENELDLIIAPMWTTTFGEPDVRQTAASLSTLCPNGHLVFLSDSSADRGMPQSIGEHLSAFPGECQLHEHSPGVLRSLASRWGGFGRSDGFQTVTFRTPEYRILPQQWLAISERALATSGARSCDSQRIERPFAEMRDAA